MAGSEDDKTLSTNAKNECPLDSVKVQYRKWFLLAKSNLFQISLSGINITTCLAINTGPLLIFSQNVKTHNPCLQSVLLLGKSVCYLTNILLKGKLDQEFMVSTDSYILF